MRKKLPLPEADDPEAVMDPFPVLMGETCSGVRFDEQWLQDVKEHLREVRNRRLVHYSVFTRALIKINLAEQKNNQEHRMEILGELGKIRIALFHHFHPGAPLPDPETARG